MTEIPNFLCVHQGHELYGSDRMFISSVKALRQTWPHSKITVHLPKKSILSEYLNAFTDEIVCGDLFVLRRSSIKLFNWKSLLNFPRAFTTAWRLCRTHDVIYINTITIISYLAALLFLQKKFFLHAHESPPVKLRFAYSLFLKFCRVTLLANSVATQKDFSQKLQSCVVLNGYGDKAERNIDDIGKNYLSLLLPGRFNAWKGQLLAIQAMSEIKGNVILKIIGSMYDKNADYLKEMQALVTKLDLSSRVEILSFSENMDDLYSDTDIVLMPSTKPEPFGLVAIEAMRHGVPVIASSHGGLMEIVRNNETGLLIEPNNVQALVQGILHYQQNPDQMVLHGEQGRSRYLEHFTAARYERDFIETVYRHVA